ncbi:MAG: NUDIX pyrophosphatase [Chloroflexota bacterium]|nr:MAG: NUDIX pyrophosphatase [Chloroflexota bacterium]
MDEKRVVTCFLENEDRVLLLRRSQRVGTYRGRWAGVSGFVEEGVSPEQQAVQEIREEVGLEPADVRLVASGKPVEVVDMQLNRKWIVHPFLFEVRRPEQLQIDWEHTEVKWIDPREIREHETVPGLDRAWESAHGHGA